MDYAIRRWCGRLGFWDSQGVGAVEVDDGVSWCGGWFGGEGSLAVTAAVGNETRVKILSLNDEPDTKEKS